MKPKNIQQNMDEIDKMMAGSWEEAPADLLSQLEQIPAQVSVANQLKFKPVDFGLNLLVYGVIYAWIIGMFMIFRSTLLASITKVGQLLQTFTPTVELPGITPWIPLGIIMMIGLLITTHLVLPEPLQNGYRPEK